MKVDIPFSMLDILKFIHEPLLGIYCSSDYRGSNGAGGGDEDEDRKNGATIKHLPAPLEDLPG